MSKTRTVVGSNAEDAAEKATKLILKILNDAVSERGKATLILSGGESPKHLYRQLLKDGKDFPWKKVLFFFTDERCVSPDHPRSNFGLAREHFFSKLKLPDSSIFRMKGEKIPTDAAEEYERLLKDYSEFDLALLGMTKDGSTASLFPGSPVLEEKHRNVRVTQSSDGETRVTLTPLAFSSARHVIFFATGAEKANAISELFSGTNENPSPARVILDMTSNAHIVFDRSAGSRVGQKNATIAML